MPDGQLLESTRADQTSHYIYLGNRLIAVRASSPSGAKVTYLHHDAMNTLVATSDASGSVISRHFWSPMASRMLLPIRQFRVTQGIFLMLKLG